MATAALRLRPRLPGQWDVEALEPNELQRLVLTAVDPYIDAGTVSGGTSA
ncbi:hypothetical protein [Streptomyces sp. NPDC017949]